ncbi:MAG: FAD-dependent monooxygenase [Gammaproteobacteria bacterium]|nr:FAD-dependent monooxygenase [Gammaproteobacteria bacterium]
MKELKKILVVGASIAGPSIAYWLDKYGFSPTLIEKSPEPRKGGYAIDIRGKAVDVVKMMGLYESICASRTTLKSGQYVDKDGKVLHEESGEQCGFRDGEDVEINRNELSNILRDALSRVPIKYGISIKSLNQHPDHVEVAFSDGSHDTFDLVIGSDGLHSSIRKMAFNTNEYVLSDLGFYLAVFSGPNYLKLNHSGMFYEYNERELSVVSDKDPKTALFWFMGRTQAELKVMKQRSVQKAFIHEQCQGIGWESEKILALLDAADDLYFDSITQVKMESWSKGRVVLLGDSGYCASPLSGQGTSLALIGAYILAGELKSAKGDYETAFERYQSLFTPFVNANQSFAVWASKTYLAEEEEKTGSAEQINIQVMEKMTQAKNAIQLPAYA